MNRNHLGAWLVLWGVALLCLAACDWLLYGGFLASLVCVR